MGSDESPDQLKDAGIFAHQVRITPDNRYAVLVTRGNEGTPQKAEDPGAIKVFCFKDGQLTPADNIIGGKNGFDYRPRHVDFHPTQPWMYVSIETQNQMHLYRMQGGKPLPGRTNIVVSRDPDFAPEGVLKAADLDDALRLARADAQKRGVGEIMLIGGSGLFEMGKMRALDALLPRTAAVAAATPCSTSRCRSGSALVCPGINSTVRG